MTQDDVDRIENEKMLAKLRIEQEKALAEAKKAELAKIAEPVEFKEPEDLESGDEATEPVAGATSDIADMAPAKKGKKK